MAGQRCLLRRVGVLLLWGLYLAGCVGRESVVPSPAPAEVPPPPVPQTVASPMTLPQQVTSSPADAWAPALSPDGSRVLFVSNRSGNLDIWLHTLQGATPEPDWQLTWAPSTDTDPAWSPDGMRVAFTSHRSDPQGDIVVLTLPSRAPTAATPVEIQRLTDLATADTAPVWRPDGRFIVYTARQGVRQAENLWRLDVDTGARQQLTQDGGRNAAFTPDGAYLAYVVSSPQGSHLWMLRWSDGMRWQLTQGAVLDGFGAWSRDGGSLFFTRYGEDTNSDGQVTIDDNPGIWRLDFPGGRYEGGARPAATVQLTGSQTYSLSPTAGTQWVYFAANHLGSLGIWRLPHTGTIAQQASAAAQMALARTLAQREPDNISLQILAWQRVRQHFPQARPALLAEALYETAMGYRRLGQHRDAAITLQTLRADFPQVRRYTGLAAVENVRLQAEQTGSNLRPLYQQLLHIREEYADQPGVGAAALLAQGALALELRETVQALQAYDDVLTHYPSLQRQGAEALFRKAEIYALLQDLENVLATYLDVVQRYPAVRDWGTKAAEAALALLLGRLEGPPALIRLRELIDTYGALPIVPALAQRQLGDVHRQRQEVPQATAAYQRVVDAFPREIEQVQTAQFALADMAQEAGQEHQALAIYADLIQGSGADTAMARQARQRYIAVGLRKAKRERQQRDPRLALNTYAQLLALAPDTIAAYRGAIALYAEVGEINRALQRYRQAVGEMPQRAAAHYALGLAYTYTDPPRFAAAERELLLARERNGQEVLIHQALGFVYEQQGRRQRDIALLEQALASYQTAWRLNDQHGDADNRANLSLNLGNVFTALDNPTMAVQHYRQRAAMPTPFPHPTTALLFHTNYGIAASKSGDLQESQAHLQQALELARETKRPALQAELWDRLGLSYQEQQQYDAAVEAFTRALELHREQGNRRNAHLSLRNLANNRFFLAQARGEQVSPELLSRSLESYYASLESIADYTPPAKRREDDGGLINIDTTLELGADDSQAAQGFDQQGEMKLIFTNIGRIYEGLGDYEQARRFFRQKLDLLPPGGAAAQTLPVQTEKALLLNQLGYFSYRLGDLPGAQRDFMASLAVCQALNNAACTVINQANLGRTLAELAAAQPQAVTESALQQAIAGQHAALTLLEASPALSQGLYPLLLRHNAGMLSYHLAQYFPGATTAPTPQQAVRQTLTRWQQYHGYAQDALEFFAAALQQASTLSADTKVNPARVAAVLHHNQAQVWRLLGQEDEARAALQRAVTLADAFFVHDLQWQLRLTLAALPTTGELSALQAAIRSLEESPAALAFGPHTERVLTRLDHLYGRTVALLIEQKQHEAAYIMAERWQAQRLVARLSAAATETLPFTRDIDQALRGDAQQLVHDMRLLQTQLATPERIAALLALQQTPVAALDTASVVAPMPSAAEQELRATYRQLLTSYTELVAVMRQERPELATLFTAHILEPVELQELLAPDSLLVKYTLLPGRLLIWVVDQERFTFHEVPLAPPPFAAIMARVREQPARLHAGDLRQLSAWFVAPIAARIADNSRLYIVPDTRLALLPWAALERQQVSLAETSQLSVVHSGYHLFQAWHKRSLYHERLLVARPGPSEQPPAAWFKALQQVAATVTVVGDTANSKQRFLADVPAHDVVHVHAPLAYNQAVPLRSALRFGDGKRHYSQLDVREFYGLQANANLIVFAQPAAALPSGALLQTLDHSLLFAGFAAALMRHGSPDAVYDSAFLAAFYTQLAEHAVGKALWLAQQEMRQQQPQHNGWRQFQLYGYLGMNTDERQAFAQAHYRQVLQEASTALQQHAWPQAATALERAARLSHIVQAPQGLPVIYQRLTEAYRHERQYDHAIAAQQRLLALAQEQGQPAMIAEAHHTLGILYSDAENFPAAVRHLQQAVALQQEHGLTQQLPRSFTTLGIAQERGAAYQEALESFQHSLQLLEDMGSPEGVGAQLRRLGRIALLRLNDYAAAMTYFERALPIFAEAEEHAQVVQVRLEIGRVHQQWGNFAAAMQAFEQAAHVAEAQQDQTGLAQAHIDMANTSWLRGAYQDAFDHQRQGLRLAEQANAGLQKLLATNVLGLIYWTLNDAERARHFQTQALQLARELALPHEEATIYNNTGIIDRQQKRYEAALQAFKRALEIDTALASRWGQAYAQRNLGMTYLQIGDLDQALTHLHEAERLSRAIGDRSNTAKVLLSLGDTRRQSGKRSEAHKHYTEALAVAEAIGVPEVAWRARYGLGRLRQQQGQVQQALAQWRQAIEIVEALRAAIQVEEFRNGFLEDKLDLYEAIIFLLLEQGRTAEAFQYAERARARSFIDLLGNQRVRLQQTVSGELLTAHQTLRNRLQQLQAQLAQAPPTERPGLEQALAQQRQRYEELLIEIKSTHPQLSTFVTVAPLTLAQVQQLLEPQVALVEYFVGREQLAIWALTRDEVQVHRATVTRQALSQQVRDYRQRLSQLEPVDQEAQALYNILVRPVAAALKSMRYVGIIPHESLHYLAFAALHDGQQYVVDAYPIFYSPSASVLRFTFAKRRTQPKKDKVLAIGNPDLGTLNYDLPLAEKEVRSLQWPFPDVTVLTRDKALESWIVQHISEYGIIHIASHGEFDSINPLFSSLKLARDTEADGDLEVNEIFGLDIQADLVTLSACQTGLGALSAGNELVGLTRAFIYAGTHAIIASLWRIDDLASAVLMKHFYRQYTQLDKAESLRQAQRTVRQQFSHPTYWAGFSLSGDYR